MTPWRTESNYETILASASPTACQLRTPLRNTPTSHQPGRYRSLHPCGYPNTNSPKQEAYRDPCAAFMDSSGQNDSGESATGH